MNSVTYLEHRASSRLNKHEGESSLGLCDRLDRTRDNSQRQLPTNHDYAVPTREYQTDQSSLITAPDCCSLCLRGKANNYKNKPTHREVDTVTPYQALALIENNWWAERPISTEKWDEQVLRIGETVSHEKDGAAPHRRSTE